MRDNYLKLIEITVQSRTFIEDVIYIIKSERGGNEVERTVVALRNFNPSSIRRRNVERRREESGNVRKRRDVNKSKAWQATSVAVTDIAVNNYKHRGPRPHYCV